MHTLSSTSLAVLTLAALAANASAQTLQKTITYTRFLGQPDNVRQAQFTYNAGSGTTSFSGHHTVGSTPGADGVLFAPDGDLIVGGQGDAVHKIQLPSGTVTTVNNGGVLGYHVMLDPSGTTVWCAALPGHLSQIPLYPFANGTAHSVSGDTPAVTHLAFANGNAYYTASLPSGAGDFGMIDMTTFVTTRLHQAVPWAHGMTYDCYTGHIIVFANSNVVQLDPVTNTIVSQLDVSPLNLNLDQGTSDGEGHLFIASNTGHMLFLDITVSHEVGNPDFVDAPFLDAFLDDIAPDCGLGGPPSCPLSQGYWRTHGSAWPVASLTIGCQNYSKAACLALMATPVAGDASLILAYQLIAAKVNVANNANNWPLIAPIIDQADALLCTYPGALPLGIPAGSPAGAQMKALAAQLEQFNIGNLSPNCFTLSVSPKRR